MVHKQEKHALTKTNVFERQQKVYPIRKWWNQTMMGHIKSFKIFKQKNKPFHSTRSLSQLNLGHSLSLGFRRTENSAFLSVIGGHLFHAEI